MTNLVKVTILLVVVTILVVLGILGYRRRGAIRAMCTRLFGTNGRVHNVAKTASYKAKEVVGGGVVFEKPVVPEKDRVSFV